MHYFTHEIWKSLRASAHERARYLKNLYLDVVKRSVPTWYLDIGAGLGCNTLVFGEGADDIVAIDLRFPKNNVLKGVQNVHMIIANAQFLPLRRDSFDVVSLFSVIEHVADQRRALREAVRVLKLKGDLIVQVPNKFFPIELHSGLPLVFLVPFKIRGRFFGRIGHGGLGRINVPSVMQLEKMVLNIGCKCEVRVRRVVYPSVVVWSKLRFFYKVASKAGILNAIPLGYLLILKKRAHISM